MTKTDHLSRILNHMFALLGRKPDPIQIKAWTQELEQSGYTVEQVQRLAKIATTKADEIPIFFTIANFKSIDQVTDLKALSANAWEFLMLALQNSREADNKLFKHGDDALIKAVKALGGSYYLGGLDYKELEFKRKQFIEAYQASSKTSDTLEISGGIDGMKALKDATT